MVVNFSEVPMWFWALGWALCGVACAAWMVYEAKRNETVQHRLDVLFSLLGDVFRVRPETLFMVYVALVVATGPVIGIILAFTGVASRTRDLDEDDF